MREIKFRGKRLDNGEWEYGDLAQFGQKYYTPCKCAIIPGTASGSDTFFKVLLDNEVDPTTVGQYTGLKDRNGKEIYEGDILATDERIIGYVVGGVRGYCYDVNYINHPTGERRWTLYATITTDYPNKLAVVGNVFDNPELLKGGEQ